MEGCFGYTIKGKSLKGTRGNKKTRHKRQEDKDQEYKAQEGKIRILFLVLLSSCTLCLVFLFP